MFRKFVMLALSVSLLGFSIGCGGPGTPTTVEDRPAGLMKPGGPDQKVNTDAEGNDLPEGVAPVD